MLKVGFVLKDLGLDCTLGRRRIVKQQRGRRQKGLSRLWKLKKFPKGNEAVCLKLMCCLLRFGDVNKWAFPGSVA